MIYEERDSRYWRAKAAEARAKADSMHEPFAIATMTQVADSYDLLAAMAEKREAANDRSSN